MGPLFRCFEHRELGVNDGGRDPDKNGEVMIGITLGILSFGAECLRS